MHTHTHAQSYLLRLVFNHVDDTGSRTTTPRKLAQGIVDVLGLQPEFSPRRIR
jgi:hypothetical protein